MDPVLVKKNNKYTKSSLLKKVGILKEKHPEQSNMIDLLLDAIRQPEFKYLHSYRDRENLNEGAKKNNDDIDEDEHLSEKVIRDIVFGLQFNKNINL